MNRTDALVLLAAATLGLTEALRASSPEPSAAAPLGRAEAPLGATKPLRPEPLPPPATPDCPRRAVPLPEVAMMGDDAPIPAIEDPEAKLDTFYEGLSLLAKGQRKAPLRIAIYSDSQGLKDTLPGALRRRLQSLYGDAGHGFVAPAKVWGWYQHMDVRHGTYGGWSGYNVTTQPSLDGLYGHGLVGVESAYEGAVSWMATGASKGIGEAASRLEIAYARGPRFGRFEVRVDGQKSVDIDTQSPRVEAGFTDVSVPDGPHRFEVVSKGSRPVRLFGLSLSRDVPGVVVDGLSVGALNCWSALRGDQATFDATFARRAYDVVIVHIGSNLFFPEQVAPCFQKLFAKLEHASPGVPVLLMTPVDYLGYWQPPHSTGWMMRAVAEMKKIALETKTPLFDFWSAMGGDGSMKKFIQAKMNIPGDHIHMDEAGMAYMAGRVHYALARGLAEHEAKRVCP